MSEQGKKEKPTQTQNWWQFFIAIGLYGIINGAIAWFVGDNVVRRVVNDNFSETKKSIKALRDNQRNMLKILNEQDWFKKHPDIHKIKNIPDLKINLADKTNITENNKITVAAMAKRVNFPTYFEYVANQNDGKMVFNASTFRPKREQIRIELLGMILPKTNSSSECERERAEKVKTTIVNLLGKAKKIDFKNLEEKNNSFVDDIYFDKKSLREYLISNELGYEYDGKNPEKIDWCPKNEK